MKGKYSSDAIRALNCQYNIIIGRRSNGKTFDSLLRGMQDFWKDKKTQFALVRRWDEDFTKQRGATMFQSLICDGEGKNRISEITNGQYDNVYYYSRRWYFCKWDEELNKRVTMDEPFAYGFSLSAMEHDKSTSYPFIKTIIFDEFISRGAYLKDEFVLFMNVISTIVRDRLDVKIFMLGNTVNQYCPYFEELGLTNIRKQEPGTIDVYQMGAESQLRVAVEYCKDSAKSVKSRTVHDTYFAFDNPKLQMITDGVWEMEIYPHCPVKYTSKDIAFTFFIIFKTDTLQCEVVSQKNTQFIFIHRKTTPLQSPDKDLIFSLDYDPRPNWRRRITRPQLPVEQKIVKLFNAEKVYYQDNQVGEIVRNYLLICKEMSA